MASFGQSSLDARSLVVKDIKVELELYISGNFGKHSSFREIFVNKYSAFTALVCIALLISSTFGLSNSATYISAAVIVTSLIISMLFQCASARIVSIEVALRIMTILREFEISTQLNDTKTQVGVSSIENPSVLIHGNSQMSIFITLRDSCWQRLPLLLMVKGDIFALMSGSYPPGLCVELEENGLRETGRQLKSSDRSELRRRSSRSVGYCEPLMHDSTQILSYSGDIRCYKLLETPAASHVRNLLKSEGTPKSLIRKVCLLIAKYSWNTLLVTLFLCLASGIVRVLSISSLTQADELWVELIFSQTSTALIPLLPFCFPVILVIGEALMTAWLLSVVHLWDLRWNEKQTHTIRSSRLYGALSVMSNAVFGIGDKGRRGFIWFVGLFRRLVTYLTSLPCCKRSLASRPILCYDDAIDEENNYASSTWCCSPYSKNIHSSSSKIDDGPRDEEPDLFEEDVEEKSDELEEVINYGGSSRSRHLVSSASTQSFKRLSSPLDHLDMTDDEIIIGSDVFWAYFREVMNLRLIHGINLIVTDSVDSIRLSPASLEVPLSHLHVLETLGAINTISFIDDDTVCCPESIVEEVFFLSFDDNASDPSKSVWEKKLKANAAAKVIEGQPGPCSPVTLALHSKISDKFLSGSRFEDSNWVKHMASLKPIGLACAATWKQPLETFSVEYWNNVAISRRTNRVLGSKGPSHSSEHLKIALTAEKKNHSIHKSTESDAFSYQQHLIAMTDEDDEVKTIEDSPNPSPTHEMEKDKEASSSRERHDSVLAFSEISHDDLQSEVSISKKTAKARQCLEPIALQKSSGLAIHRTDSEMSAGALKHELSVDISLTHGKDKDVPSARKHKHKHLREGYFDLFRPRTQQICPKIDTMEDIIMTLSKSVPSGHLREFSENIGFVDKDLCHYLFKADLQELRLVEDYHALGLEESRRRGRLRAGMRSVVVQQKIDALQGPSSPTRFREKSISTMPDNSCLQGPFQLLSKGKLEIVLSYSSTYWDGQTVSALTEREVSLARNAWQQWSLADYDVTALSYAPLPFYMHDIIMSSPISELSNAAEKGDASAVKRDDQDGSRVRRAGSRKYHHARKSTAKEILEKESSFDDTNKDSMDDVCVSLPYREMDSQTAEQKNLHLIAVKPPLLFLDRRAFCPESPLLVSNPSDAGAMIESKSELSHTSNELESAKIIVKLMEDEVENPEIPQEEKIAMRKKERRSRRSKKLAIDDVSDEVTNPKDVADDVCFSSNSTLDGLISKSSVASLSIDGDEKPTSPTREASLQSADPLPIIQNMGLEQCFWQSMQEQTFLGMVASSVPPRQGLSNFVDRMDKFGIRFQYFSPRNMRRTKSLAEKLGIETDWNCAISLRPLDIAGIPDPHRMTSSYADWDVLAKMPHGVDAIRQHLINVDNVPLLVSLFTDCTPPTIRGMFKVLQDYEQVVMAIGSSYKFSNSSTFKAADISISINMLPGDQSIESDFSSQLTPSDITFNARLISLSSCCSIGSCTSPASRSRRTVDLKGLNQIIQQGRRMLANIHQSIAFSVVACLSLSSSVTLSIIGLPISLPPAPRPASVMILLYCVISLVSLGLLFSRVGTNSISRVSNKNLPIDCDKLSTKAANDVKKFVYYAIVHAIPSTILSVLMSWWALTRFVSSNLIPDFRTVNCLDSDSKFLCTIDVTPSTDSFSYVKDALGVVGDVSILVLCLCLWAQSASFVTRLYYVFSEEGIDLIKNSPIWFMTVLWSVVLMTVYFVGSFSRGEVRMELLQVLPPVFWVALALCPAVSFITSETVKMREKKFSKRQADFLRLEFDTRLGMHSPR